MLRYMARKAGMAKDIQNQATKSRIDAERRAGQLLSRMDKNTGGRPLKTGHSEVTGFEAPPTYDDIGIHKMQAHRWMTMAALPEEAYEEHVADTIIQHDYELTSAGVYRYAQNWLGKHHNIHVLTSSESNEWYTPAVYVDAARMVMGNIDVDPASSDIANRTVRADVYYTLETDGLKHDWPGRVWMNPPYGDGGPKFVKRLLEQYEAGITTEAVVLLNAHVTDTQWFAPLWNFVLCFTDHRINYTRGDGGSDANAPRRDGTPGSGSTHGSVFVYLGPSCERFADIFRRFGRVVNDAKRCGCDVPNAA